MSTKTNTINIRPATQEDQAFLRDMAYEAAFPEDMVDRPTPEAAQQVEWLPAYTEDWGTHSGDYGLIAEDETGKPVGAAWYRNYSDHAVSQDVPPHELSIALTPESRGNKVGENLMIRLLEGASSNGVDEISLIVRESNERARHLYNKLGFEALQTEEGFVTMKAPAKS